MFQKTQIITEVEPRIESQILHNVQKTEMILLTLTLAFVTISTGGMICEIEYVCLILLMTRSTWICTFAIILVSSISMADN